MADLVLEGMALAEGVVETIVAIALGDLEGVRLVNSGGQGGPLGVLTGRAATQAIELSTDENNTIKCAVHVDVDYGKSLPEVAASVRQLVSDAVLAQVGVEVSAVDVYIDGISF